MDNRPEYDASTPRPNGEPYYIDSECPECGTGLELYDKDKAEEEKWYDEWTCPDEECSLTGIIMDWPAKKKEELMKRIQNLDEEDLKPL